MLPFGILARARLPAPCTLGAGILIAALSPVVGWAQPTRSMPDAASGELLYNGIRLASWITDRTFNEVYADNGIS
jgi:hypothetical protein